MSKVVMPDLAELRRLTGHTLFWSVTSSFSGEHVFVGLMARRRYWLFGWRTEDFYPISAPPETVISTDGGDSEWLAHEIQWKAREQRDEWLERYAPQKIVDVNGLTGAEFGPRIKHGGSK